MITQDLYVLEGGIGKNICFTNCLNKLGKVNLMSTWPKVFLHHPNVNYCYNYMINPIRDDVEFFNKFKNIHFVEGYDSYFLKNKIHLVNNFRKILNQDVDEAIYNEIYFSEEEEENIKPLLEQLNNFVLVQFVGTDEGHQDTDFITSRSLLKQEAQKIIDIINFELKLNVVNVFSKKNYFDNVAQLDIKLDYRNYAHLIKHAKAFIGIDSCINHMSANRFCKTRGVVLWNDQNVSERFLYDKNINLITNTPGVMRFDAQIVVDNLMNVLKEKNND